jgi:hypothetical protein
MLPLAWKFGLAVNVVRGRVVWKMYSPSFIVCRLRRRCPTSLCSIHSVAGARKDLRVCRSGEAC